MIVATAGHIDHGKTTLVKALTGVDTDRLPEEKARGISIDLGFAYWKLSDGNLIGFVDVPGHERFIRNMLAGVSGIDYVMLIVAADDGVMPQTIEHLQIVNLLNVSRGVAVITKMDRVGSARVSEVVADVRQLLQDTVLSAMPILCVSATTGEGVEGLRDELAGAARAHVAREHAGRHFRYAIDRAFTIVGSGTVVTGTVFNGAVSVGDKLLLSPLGLEVRVRGLEKQGAAAKQAVAGERCALNLTGVALDQLGRGDWVVSPEVHAPTQRMDVRLRVLASEEQALKHWTSVQLHTGTTAVTARVAIKRGGSIAPGASGIVQLISSRPLSVLHGDRFIVRDQSSIRTIGGGSVIDPFPPGTGRHSPERTAQLAALESADPAQAFSGLLACSSGGVDVAQFGRSFNLAADRMTALIKQAGASIFGKENPIALPGATVDGLKKQVLEALTTFHRESPQALGAETDALRKSLAPKISAATFTLLLRELAEGHNIELTGSTARLTRHVATANPADQKMWQSIKPMLDAAGFNVPVLRELATAASLKEAILKDFLYRKSRTGEVVRVTADRFYPRETLAQLAALARSTAEGDGGGQFTAAQFRDRSGLGRTLAIEILECLDRLGITQRIGNARKMVKDFVPILGAAIAPARANTKQPAVGKPGR